MMFHNKVSSRLLDSIYLRYTAICLSFCCGIYLGFCYYSECSALLGSQMYKSVFAPISFGGLFGPFLPITIAFLLYALIYNTFPFLCACLIEGFLTTLATIACFCGFGRGAWLVSLCVLFSAYSSCVLTIVSSIVVFANRKAFHGRHFCLCFAFMLVIILFHYFCLQPYLLAVI